MQPSPILKKRWVHITFTRSLTEKEENILIVNLQAVKTETSRELRRTWEKLSRKRFEHLRFIPGFALAIDFMKARVAVLGGGVDDYFELNKTGNVYHFGYAWEELKVLNANIGILGRQLRIPEPSLMNEGNLVKGLNEHVFKDMGIPKGEVTVTVDDNEPKEELIV